MLAGERMKPATRIEELLADHDGRYIVGRNWLYFSVDAKLFGQFHWGRPEADDIERLMALWEIELRESTPRHASLIDASRLEGLSADLFANMTARVRLRADVLARKLTQQALVRPAGLTGAVIAGVSAVIPFPYPQASFVDLQSALAWLDRLDALPALLELASKARVDAVVQTQLRAALRQQLVSATIDDMALVLGIARRTLQRRLREANTSFNAEIARARVERAQELLRDTDRQITDIALEVCASAGQFAELFRRETGMTASEWRAKTRGT